MKLLNIILLCGLVCSAHPKIFMVDAIWSNDVYVLLKDFEKIEKLLNYFTPDAQKKIQTFIEQRETLDIKTINVETDLFLLSLMIENEFTYRDIFLKWFSDKQTDILTEFKKSRMKLLNKGFTEKEVCHKLLGSLLTDKGCEALILDPLDGDFLRPLIDFFVIYEKSNDLLNKKETNANQS